MREEFNVLKCIAKYSIEQESCPAKEFPPYMKIKVSDKPIKHLNGEKEIKQKSCSYVI